MNISDKHDRKISYLRLSVTDQCNLRCRYCVPQSGLHNFPKMPLLSFEDLYRVARQSALLGIRKIRVTGGEPLVRPGIVQFLERVNGIPGIGEVVLTTNGILLDRLADPLRRAGVKRLNISLDSLKPETFAAITGGGNLSRVLEGIAAAERAGFPPPQINVVVLRGINSEEILSFAANVSGLSESRLILSLLTPARRKGSANLSSSIPLVVRTTSPIPGIPLTRSRNCTMPGRTSGSPPVTLIFRIPRSADCRATRYRSSKDSRGIFGKLCKPLCGTQ